MTQPELVERAKNGDPKAIASLLSRILHPRGVTVKVHRREGCLHILLSSDRYLDEDAYLKFVRRQIEHIQLASIQSVKVYGQQIGARAVSWYQEFVPASSSKLVRVERSQSSPEPPDFLQNLKTFQFSSVFPYRDVLKSELYRHPTVKLLLFLGLFPLIVNLINDGTNVGRIAWLLGIYYASIWGFVLFNLIKPVQVSWGDTLKCVLFTAFIGIPLLIIFQQVPILSPLYAAIDAGFIQRLIGFIFGVGLLEELCKGIPVYLFLLRPGKLHDPLTAAFYGAMSGLGFSIAEGAAYSLFYALGLERGDLSPGTYVIVNTVRFVSLPLFHAILAGIVGYFIGLAAINPSRHGAIIFIGVAIAATLHGLYNTFSDSILGLFIVGFSILLFVTYLRRSKQMVDEMQHAEFSKPRKS
ncbi:MAG: PrsW family intramembrane metalloprotease [Elainellaceae cyanobacterium]